MLHSDQEGRRELQGGSLSSENTKQDMITSSLKGHKTAISKEPLSQYTQEFYLNVDEMSSLIWLPMSSMICINHA